MKWLYRILLGFGLFVVIVAAGTGVLLETQAGLRWAVARVESFSAGAVKIGAAHGRLAGPFTLDDLRVTLSGETIETRHLELDWHPLALIGGELHVSRLQGSDVRITIRPSGSETKTSSQGLPRKLDLPLRIVVDHAQFKQLTLRTTGHNVRLDRLAFALDASDAAVKLNKLEVRGPDIALGGELHTQPHGDWPVQAQFALLLRPPGYPTVGGHTRLDGSLRGTLRLQQTLKIPFQAELKARVTGLFGTPNAHGTLHLAQFDPHALKPAWPELAAGADLAFDGSLKHFTTHGTLTLTAPQKRTVKLNLEAGLGNQRINVERLNLALAGTPARLALHGTLQTAAPHTADITVAWKHLSWPLQGAASIARAAAGGAHLTGNPNKWMLTLRTLLQAHGLPRGRWALEAHGNTKQIELTALAGRWLDGTLAGHGKLRLESGHPFQFSARVRNVKAQTIDPKVQGQVGFDLTASGQLDPMQAQARISKLAGRLQGQSVTGKADVAYAKDILAVHTLVLAVGPNRLDAQGRLGTNADFTWQLQAPRLAALGNGLGGRVNAKGSIRGKTDAPHFRMNLNAIKLRWNDLAIARTEVTANVNLSAQAASSLELHIKNFERGNVELQQLDAKLDGPPQSQHFLVSVRSNEGDIELAGNGRFAHGRWVGHLATGKLKPAKGPAFTLGAPAGLTLGKARLELGKSCWHGAAQGQFCLAAASGKQGWKADLALQDIPLDMANPYLSQGLTLSGALNGKLTAQGGNGTLHALGEIHADHGAVIRNANGKTQRFAFDVIGLETRMNSSRVTARLGLILDDGGLLDATAEIPWRTRTRLSGKLHLRAHLPNLSGLGALSDAIANLGGRLNADLEISGNVKSPRFAGYVRLSNAALTLPRFGTRIEKGNIALHGTGPGVRIQGSLADGGNGHLAVQGTLQQSAGQWSLEAQVKGKKFQAADMPEAKVTISPDLDIGVKGYAITLKGTVDVPAAQIKPPHFSNAISPTPDLVVVGEKKARKGPPWRLTAQLHINLGDDVHFTGYGLAAQFGGGLTINDTPGKLTTASGEVKILNGHYKAYGQDLTIQHGRIMFSGGFIANPGLDIRATRTAGLVTAGLQISGTLNNPKLQVFSEPPMSQANALAYLLFGHGIQQASSSQQSTINSAANAIGLAGGTFIVKSLSKHVGIDTVSVENANPYSTSTNQASLFLGKYLSPRLYVSYGIGLYAPIDLLRIRYTLSRHWALEAESGTFSGADILFNIEH